jgi:DNA repair exonuclease SbcCD ATPase subunit
MNETTADHNSNLISTVQDEKIRELESNIEILKEESRSKLTFAVNKIKELKQICATKTDELSQAHTQITQLEQTVESLKQNDKQAELEQKLNAAIQEKEAFFNQVNDLFIQRDALKDELLALKEFAKKNDGKMIDYEDTTKILKQELEKASTERANFQEQLIKAQISNEECKLQLEQRIKDQEQMKIMMNKAVDRIKFMKQELENKTNDLNIASKCLDEMKEQNEHLNEIIQRLELEKSSQVPNIPVTALVDGVHNTNSAHSNNGEVENSLSLSSSKVEVLPLNGQMASDEERKAQISNNQEQIHALEMKLSASTTGFTVSTSDIRIIKKMFDIKNRNISPMNFNILMRIGMDDSNWCLVR